jgi:ATP-dependent helicase HrpA
VARILDAAREVERRLETLSAPAFEPARRDVRAQLARLVFAGFAARTGAARLADVERYLQAAARRLDRLPDATAVDLDRMRAVQELEQAHRRRLDAWPRGRALPQALREVPWMLEELRVSQFAQGLGTRGPVSAKRIRRALEDAAA